MYCTHCLQECVVVLDEVGHVDHYDYAAGQHWTSAIMGDVSVCCRAEVGEGEPPPPLCRLCGEPAVSVLDGVPYCAWCCLVLVAEDRQ